MSAANREGIQPLREKTDSRTRIVLLARNTKSIGGSARLTTAPSLPMAWEITSLCGRTATKTPRPTTRTKKTGNESALTLARNWEYNASGFFTPSDPGHQAGRRRWLTRSSRRCRTPCARRRLTLVPLLKRNRYGSISIAARSIFGIRKTDLSRSCWCLINSLFCVGPEAPQH